MKKIVLSTILLLFIVTVAGCSKKELALNVEEVTVSTLLAKANGELQVATVETFDKNYYKLSELQDYVEKTVADHNKVAGGDKISIDNVELRDGKAIMILSYSGMDQYAAFNEVNAAYFNGGIGEHSLKLPATLISSKNDSLASTEEVIQNPKYKVLIINEAYDILVDGKVVYYSDNAKLLENNKVQAAAEGATIVVFKP